MYNKTPTVSLDRCNYEKSHKRLTLSSEEIGMPRSFFVKSHFTGKTIEFTTIGYDDPLFDPDGWDGEASYYRPVTPVPNVEYFVIANFY